MDVADRVRSGVKWLAFGKFGSQAVTWTFSILTLRLIAPDDYGLLAMASIFILFLALFQELGLRVRLVQLLELDREYVRAVYGMSVLTNVVLASLLIAGAPLIAALFAEPRLTAVVMVLAGQFVISSLAVIPDAMIRRNLDFRAMAAIEIAQGLAAASAALALAWYGFGVWALVAATIVGTSVRTVGLIWVSPFRALPSFRFKGMQETLLFGGHVTGQRVLWWAYTSFDKFLLGRMFDVHTVGLYSVAQHLAHLPLEKMGSTVATASFAGLSRVAGDPPTFRTYLLKGLALLSIVGVPVFLGIAVVAEDLVPLLLGAKWASVAPIVTMICLVMPLRMLNGPLVESLNSVGRPALGMAMTGVTAISVIAGVAIGIRWGAMGVATAWGVAFALSFVGTTIYMLRRLGVSVVGFLRAVLPSVIAGVIMVCVVKLARGHIGPPVPSLPSLLASIVIGATVYVGTIALIDRSGLRLVRGMIRR
jgi:teichuronic acid exporter